MQRRRFLATSILGSAAALSRTSLAQQPPAPSREYYLLRRYALQSGPQTGLSEHYISDALIPALTRRGLGPVGAFQLDIGPDTPAHYVLIPGRSPETLATLDLDLAEDAEFLKAGEPFWTAPATNPSFKRAESWLLGAFDGWPRLTPPPNSKAKRILQLRTYESPSDRDHVRKVEMFHVGEFDIFLKAGFHPVFYSSTLIGAGMPSLTYMLAFSDMAEADAKWNVFRTDPAWKKLSADPRYAFESIVSNITNLYLSPLAASHI